MYDFVDQPLERLGNGSRFVLWAMRAWANAARRGRCPRATLGGAFVNMGAPAALPDFHAAMARLDRAAGQPIGTAPLACRWIAEGEAVMLALWADLVAGRHERAFAVLRLLVPTVADADLLGESLSGAVDHLRHAGLEPAGLAARDRTTTRNTGGDE